MLALFCALVLAAQDPPSEPLESPEPPVRQWSIETVLDRTLAPYSGTSQWPTTAEGLEGRVMAGYQGWFTTPGDGAERGWTHWAGPEGFRPGSTCVDFWPDVSLLPEDCRYDTPFQHADGRAAQVFSSVDGGTVLAHFEWMERHGIDGVFLQRFASVLRHPEILRSRNLVMANVREAANRHGRAWVMMYDLSGLPEGGTQVVIDDWKQLVDRARIGRDPRDRAYLRLGGRPLVAVWGIGFNEDRAYTLAECRELVRFLQEDPDYGGNAVMIGVPTGWRLLSGDALGDELLHEIARLADVVSPWSVGRIRGTAAVADFAGSWWAGDAAWCREAGVFYLPVIYPGFSWHNQRPAWPMDEIPRDGGRFLWSQFRELRRLGIDAAYVAMFDEVDEGTAIFRCSDDPPVGETRFLGCEGLPEDHYLWLTGAGGRLLRGQLDPPPDQALPPRPAPEKD